MKKQYAWLAIIILILTAIALYLAYGFITNRQSVMIKSGPSIGVVNMEDIVKVNPSYTEYVQRKVELDQLKAQYKIEQMDLTNRSVEQAQALKTLSQDTTLTEAINIELQAKLKAKENELNEAMAKKRREMVTKYINETNKQTTPADLEIVNLQLDLMTYLNRTALDTEQLDTFKVDREKKETRLKELLAQRVGKVSSMDDIMARVHSELLPMREAGQKELNDYAEQLQKDLAAKRDELMQKQATSIMENTKLPVAAKWNDEWNQKLEDKQVEVDALHEAILEDIRMRVSVIAQEQHLDLVVTDDVANIKGLDITDAVKASYRE